MSAGIDTGTILEIVIALSFLYFLLSTICSGIIEALAGMLRWRAKDLRLGVINLLGKKRTDEFYADPRIQALGKVKRIWSWQRAGNPFNWIFGANQRSRLGYHVNGRSELTDPPPGLDEHDFQLRDPSYIPPETFAQVALDLYLRDEKLVKEIGFSDEESAKLTDFAEVAKDPEASVDRDVPGITPLTIVISRANKALDAELQKKIETVLGGIQGEFKQAMDRVSGWYKRKSTIWIGVVALVAAFALNADTLRIAEYLQKNPVALKAIVASAEKRAKSGSTRSTGDTGSTGDTATTDGQGSADGSGQPKTSGTASSPAPTGPQFAVVLAADESTTDGSADQGTDASTTESNGNSSTGDTNSDDKSKECEEVDAPAYDAKQQQWKKQLGCIAEAVNEAYAAGFPLGWNKEKLEELKDRQNLSATLLGLIITALAITLGGPFWFQMLGRLVPLRATGKVPGGGNPGQGNRAGSESDKSTGGVDK